MPDEPAAKSAKPAKGEKPVGKVEHYYPKAQAAAVGLTGDLKVGDDIHIVGHGDDVRTKVKSLQLDHEPIAAGHAGQHIGVGLAKKVHEGDDVLVVRGPPKSAAPARKAPKKAARKPKKAKAKKAARKPRRVKKAARKPKRAKRGTKAARKQGANAGRRKASKAKRGKARRR